MPASESSSCLRPPFDLLLRAHSHPSCSRANPVWNSGARRFMYFLSERGSGGTRNPLARSEGGYPIAFGDIECFWGITARRDSCLSGIDDNSLTEAPPVSPAGSEPMRRRFHGAFSPSLKLLLKLPRVSRNHTIVTNAPLELFGSARC